MARKRILPSLLLLLTQVLVSAALAQSEELQRYAALERYEAELAEWESAYGRFDLRLLEPLSSIEGLHRELGDFAAVLRVQNRRLHLVRTSLGLEHPDTIPLLEAIIQTEIRLGNVEEVVDHLRHLRTIVVENYGLESDELLAAMSRQADWYQALLYLGEDKMRARNFMKSRQLHEEILEMAEDRYGKDSPELYPWLYKRAYSLYQQVALLNASSGLRSDMVDETVRQDGSHNLNTARGVAFAPGVGSPTRNPLVFVDGEEMVGSWYARRANSYVNDIRDIAEAQGDWEAWAIAMLYYGDFSVLRGRGTGRRSHRQAIAKLLEIGIDKQRLEALLNRPMIIPAPKFYTSFDELEAAVLSASAGLSLIPEDDWEDADPDEPWQEPVHLGVFRGWENGASSVTMPPLEGELFNMELAVDQVDFSFRVNTAGRASSIDALVIEPNERRVRSKAVRAIRELRFRPALYEGKARSRPFVQMRYQIPRESD